MAAFHDLGTSEAGRALYGAVLGEGRRTVSLIAGAHSDEPVGPETLRLLIPSLLAENNPASDLLSEFRFVMAPHINPDGEALNQRWIQKWPDVEAYLQHAFRELPGRDIEFGFPHMRPENACVADFLKTHAPISLHLSLHGMGFSDGVMLLIDKHWIDHTEELRAGFSALAEKQNLPLHDHDRGGEKGFHYIGPGFATTPEGAAMRRHFLAQEDEETAAQFHSSSMEYARQLGGDPLNLVTELPLFLIRKPVSSPEPGVPTAYLEFKDKLTELRLRLGRGESVRQDLETFQIKPLDIALQVRLHLQIMDMAMTTIQTRDEART